MSSRREFLATSVVAAATLTPGRDAVAVAAPQVEPYRFDEIAERLARHAPHRQVFAVARVADGTNFGLMRHAMDAYELTMREGPGALHAAAVFYGRGVVLGLSDHAWKTFRLAEGVKRRGDLLSLISPDTNPFSADIAALSKRGATFFVCDNALADWSTYLVTSSGFNDRTIEDVRTELRASLQPGALLVPAGVAALNMAQEARFTYVQASL